MLGRFADAAFECLDLFEYRDFAADQAKHDAFVFDEAERFEVSRPLRVVFEQEVVGIRAGKELLSNALVSAGREVMPLEIATAHMDADHRARRSRRDRLVESLDVKPNQTIGILPDTFHHL